MEMTLVGRSYEGLGDHAVDIARRVVYLTGSAPRQLSPLSEHVHGSQQARKLGAETDSDLGFNHSERVTGIEPALSAWESVPSRPVMRPDLRSGLSASDRDRPLVTRVNGPEIIST
jgi:hypothetical protein